MKVIIAGSRDIHSHIAVYDAIIASGFEITEVVSGGCLGVDSIGERWAKNNSIPIVRFPANWNLHGRAAGPKRNSEMAMYADALIAIHHNGSRGTANMIMKAKSNGLKVFVVDL